MIHMRHTNAIYFIDAVVKPGGAGEEHQAGRAEGDHPAEPE